jgi:nicotinate-nucleotide--dimethylbenzimidazole phosphoribosyltransferase
MSASIDDVVSAIEPPNAEAQAQALELQARLTKPAGALGRLEELHAWAAGVRGEAAPESDRALVVVAAADHGVAADGVSAYPADVTAQMVRNFVTGGAAVNVLSAHSGTDVRIVDAGVAADIAAESLLVVKPRGGTSNMRTGPAMSREEATSLIERGAEFAYEMASAGYTIIGLGDMGIGNTTAAAAITSAITGADQLRTAGRGTGIDDEAFARKVDAITQALTVNRRSAGDPVSMLAAVGGFEIAFLTGVTLGAAAARMMVVLDGYPTTAAAMIADELAPNARAYMLASHLSAEPGHALALDHLGLPPLLDLGLRLGEGTGAALAIGILRAALRIPREMATFDSAGVSRATGETRPEA